MRKYFDSPDTTIPDHIRMIYRSFEIDSMQTETALETVLNDVFQPQFKKFRASFYTKILRLLGYRGLIEDYNKNENYQKVKTLVDNMVDGKIPPVVVYNQLLAMKRVEEPVADTTAADTTAAVVGTAAEPAADTAAPAK